jgi:hypothetical protein
MTWVELSTCQGAALSLIDGTIDPARGFAGQACMVGERSHYVRLYREVRTDQFIWCQPFGVWPPPERARERAERDYRLRVPKDEILAILDHDVWLRIRGRDGPNRRTTDRWRKELKHEFGNDAKGLSAELLRRHKEFKADPEPLGGWWSKVFLPDVTDAYDEVLLCHPVPASWIVDSMASE